jgi:hypothetical protein
MIRFILFVTALGVLAKTTENSPRWGRIALMSLLVVGVLLIGFFSL